METYEEILGRMQGTFEELAGYPADDASDIGIRLRVLAGEVSSLTAAMGWNNSSLRRPRRANSWICAHRSTGFSDGQRRQLRENSPFPAPSRFGTAR